MMATEVHASRVSEEDAADVVRALAVGSFGRGIKVIPFLPKSLRQLAVEGAVRELFGDEDVLVDGARADFALDLALMLIEERGCAVA